MSYKTISNFNSKRLDKELLNKHRDSMIRLEDIDESFRIMREMRIRGDEHWKDMHRYIFKKINDLDERGCEVTELARHYERKTRGLKINEE